MATNSYVGGIEYGAPGTQLVVVDHAGQGGTNTAETGAQPVEWGN